MNDAAWGIIRQIDTIDPPNRKRAETLIKKLMNDYPETEFGWYARGAWESLNENYRTAISYYDRSIEKNNTLYYAHNGKAYAYAKLKEYNKSFNEFTATLILKNDYAPAYVSRAWLKNHLKDYRGAIADHTNVIKTAVGEYSFLRTTGYKNRGRVKLRLKDFRGAISDYTMAIRLKPRYAEAYYDRAKAWGNLRNQAEACADLKKARELGYAGGADMLRKYCR